MKISLKAFITIVLVILLLFGITTFVLVKYSEKNTPEGGTSSSTTVTTNPRRSIPEPNSPMGELRKLNGDELIKKLENLTDEEFITIAYRPEGGAISDLTELEVFDKPLVEGEYWYTNPVLYFGTCKSKEDCESKLSNTKDNQHSIKYDFIGENEFYYEYTVTKTRTDSTLKNISRCIFIKDSIIELKQLDGSYSLEGAKFKKIDKNTVKTFFDIVVAVDPGNVIYRYLDEEKEDYIYTVYTSEVANGEVGKDDEVTLVKTEYKVNKETGGVTISEEKLKENVKVEGTGEIF